MIIDAHMHVWPDHIADAMQSQRPSGMPLRFDGKLSGLLRTMDESGIDKGLALGVGIKASTVARTNEFIGTVPRDRLVPMGTVHPDLPVEENIRSPEGQRHRRRQAAPAVPGALAVRPAGARHRRRRSPRRACR